MGSFLNNEFKPALTLDTLYDHMAKQATQHPTQLVQADMTLCDNTYAHTTLNLITRTEEFTYLPAWIRFRSTVDATERGFAVVDNAVEDPKGGMTAAQWEFRNNVGVSDALLTQNLDVFKGFPYTLSCWLRAQNPCIVRLDFRNNQSAGLSESPHVVTREWKRFSSTYIADATDRRGMQLRWKDAGGAVGDIQPQVDGNVMYMWGAQMELSASMSVYRRNGTTATNGEASICRAFDAGDGNRCYYTFPTCQDKPNNKVDGDGPGAGVRTYYFMSQAVPLPTRIAEDVRPYVKKIGVAKQKVDPKKAVTRTDRLNIELFDDFEPPPFDYDREPSAINTQTDGSYGRLFLERHRNYIDRPLTIKEGFVDNRATTRSKYSFGQSAYTYTGYTGVLHSDPYDAGTGYGFFAAAGAPAANDLVTKERDASTGNGGDQRWHSAVAAPIGDPSGAATFLKDVEYRAWDTEVISGDWTSPDNVFLNDGQEAQLITPETTDVLAVTKFNVESIDGDEVGPWAGWTTLKLWIRGRLTAPGGSVTLEKAWTLDGEHAHSQWGDIGSWSGTTESQRGSSREISLDGITREDIVGNPNFGVLLRGKGDTETLLLDEVRIEIQTVILSRSPLAHFRADVATPGVYRVAVGIGYYDEQTIIDGLQVNGLTVAGGTGGRDTEVFLDPPTGDPWPVNRRVVSAYVYADTHIDVTWRGVADGEGTGGSPVEGNEGRIGDGNIAFVEIEPSSFPLSEFRNVFKGTIKEIRTSSKGTWTIEATDILKKLKKKIPENQDSENVLTANLTDSDTVISVVNANQFADPTVLPDLPVTVRIGDEDDLDREYAVVLSRDIVANTLTVDRGRWASTAKAWQAVDEVKVVEVVVIATEIVTPIFSPSFPPILLGESVTLEPVNVVDAVIALLQYGGLSLSEIDVDGLEAQKSIWASGMGVQRFIEDQESVEKLLNQLRDLTMLQLWTTEDQVISGRFLAPPLPSDAIVNLTDVDLIMSSTSMVDDDESRLTRVNFAFGFKGGDKDNSKIEDYTNLLIRISSESEDPRNYGDEKVKTVLSEWTTDGNIVVLTSARMLNRFLNGVREVTFVLHSQTAGVLRVGDFFTITSSEIQDQFGGDSASRQFFCIARKPATGSTIQFTAIDASFLRRAAFWSPASGDGSKRYAAETAVGKRYWHQGDSIDNVVGDTREDGYYVP